ncbi:MAG: 2-oxoglutarate ferredoxin oxidoreductase subunit gamma [Candidatus Schekmanbacteria bacterium RIFCSPHIGHO2_02_FULL_38_11]|uniref:2-oxoglutarate ferredoxin oxidoreductase subunit gamma n=1 Tax=Candidatus Schekmanbacteria bacterium RIFCSPLOWO2_12_FULL_38_15 TaxID=1817883 RepID=A0A1F7SKW2_9BACT|nr:MAG: 2-oxoglutarate ferredoxin oxidoreductase subunit gamma [Candidatus Schekmanbacteria bacterium RIFCSPHIGHO2_02_FULL_38_11]OGL54413.1 MAG: 2-oxoglutarate ferredoxin oxidoreductase subunit gamma [Candidatus Schekmanbacteria bacterium RIFCSPLOWO2_12_FULL_38_15]
MSSSQYEVRLSGSGGQGLILGGVILAEAATIYDGKNAVQSQSYGPEARGGASKSDVIISNEEIDYPKATTIDTLLSLTQEACNKYVKDLKDGGTLIIDSDMVKNIPAGNYKVIKLPIVDIAKRKVGKIITANIVALGALVEITKIVSKQAIEKAVLARVPKAFLELNKTALEAGFEAARQK